MSCRIGFGWLGKIITCNEPRIIGEGVGYDNVTEGTNVSLHHILRYGLCFEESKKDWARAK
jgi:hypothetical protein